MTFYEWFSINRSFVENEIIARSLWDTATNAERERCKQKIEETMTQARQPHDDDVGIEDTYICGWISASEECKWAINNGTKS